MPMAPAFHNAKRPAYALAMRNYVTSDNNENLGIHYKLLIETHYKIGHIGFQRLQWLRRAGIFGLSDTRFGDFGIVPPK